MQIVGFTGFRFVGV